jgi:hypothetical protein
MEEKSLRSQLHTLVGAEMRLEKRANMYGAKHHEEEHKKAKEDLKIFLEKNPSMMDCVEEVEEHFLKQLYS